MNTIEETIKMAGFGKKKIMAKQIQLFEDKLSAQAEKLIATCASIKGKEQLYVTDQRVLLHEIKGIVSNDEKSIPLTSIGSINLSAKLGISTIEIVSTGNVAVINNVPLHIATEIKNIIEGLKMDTKKKEPIDFPTTPNNGNLDLRELKSLLDDGIITQAEFDAKKKQLLGL